MNGDRLSDGLADALGRIVASQRADWQRAFTEEREAWKREAERRDAEARALLAEKMVEVLSLRREMDVLVQSHRETVVALTRSVEERLATVRDGEPGKDADPVQFEALRQSLERRVDDRLAELRDGKDGRDADPAQFEALAASLTEKVDAKLATVRDGRDADPAVFDALARSLSDGVATEVANIREELRSDPNLKGEPGAPGAPGKLPIVKEWTRGVHYEGSVVTCGGSLWQASRDTGEPPGHEDWTPLALKGRDATEIEHRGLYDPNASYFRNNIVVLDGGAYWAIKNDPGPCPGDGWRELVKRGKAGKPGDRGERGERGLQGPPGKDGVGIADIERAASFLRLVKLTNGDVIPLDLRPDFEEYHAQAQA